MGKLIEGDYIGKKYNNLTVLNFLDRENGKLMVRCKCDCGNITNVNISNLKNGHTKSCGCYTKAMLKESDYVGKKYERLTVESFIRKENNGKARLYAICICECGNKKNVQIDQLKRGLTKSCGCYSMEVRRKKENKHKVHGMRKSRLYEIYSHIKQRCYNINSIGYEKWGGRGITVCDEWLDKDNGFINFYNWAISNGYSDILSIDRINNDGNYNPNNCRWATAKEQADNRRSNITISFQGKEQNLKAWSAEYNISYSALRDRIMRYGWDIEKALTTPVRKNK